jgi:hypothetical protein
MERGRGGVEREGKEEGEKGKEVEVGERESETHRDRNTVPELILCFFGEETDVFSFLRV